MESEKDITFPSFEEGLKNVENYKKKFGTDAIHHVRLSGKLEKEDGSIEYLEGADEETEYNIIFRKPNRKDIGFVEKMTEDRAKQQELLFNRLVLAGDKEVVKNNDSLFIAVMKQINETFQIVEAELKKL